MIRPVTCFLAFLSLSIFYAYGGKKYLVKTNDEEANGTTPVDGKWNDWGSWSACHKGMRYRFRKCNNPPPKNGGTCSTGKSYQEEPCPPGDNAHEGDLAVTEPKTRVPVDGFWSEWGDWNKCVGFVHVRKRKCNNPPPSNGGKSCPGSPMEEGPCQPGTTPSKEFDDDYLHSTCRNGVCREKKNSDPCIRGCEWGPWTGCGVENTKQRRCGNPPPSDGAKYCRGLSIETVPCPPGTTPRILDKGICKTDGDCHNDGMNCHGKILGTCTCSNGVCKEKKKSGCKTALDCYRDGWLCEFIDWGICTCEPNENCAIYNLK